MAPLETGAHVLRALMKRWIQAEQAGPWAPACFVLETFTLRHQKLSLLLDLYLVACNLLLILFFVVSFGPYTCHTIKCHCRRSIRGRFLEGRVMLIVYCAEDSVCHVFTAL